MNESVSVDNDRRGYDPLLGCEACKRMTRHYFIGTTKCLFRHFEEDPKPYKSEPWHFNLLMYRCINCGEDRGWGNEAIDESDNSN